MLRLAAFRREVVGGVYCRDHRDGAAELLQALDVPAVLLIASGMRASMS